jgi:hypothetical protein
MLFSVLTHGTRSSTQEDSPSTQGNYNRHLKIELVAEGLFSPTSMAFLDDHKILVLEKNTGAVRLISDGILQDKPVLKLRVDPKGERGLLGIALLHTKNNNGYYYDNNNNTEVYLYFTESKNKNDNNTDDGQLINKATHLSHLLEEMTTSSLPNPYHICRKHKLNSEYQSPLFPGKSTLLYALKYSIIGIVVKNENVILVSQSTESQEKEYAGASVQGDDSSFRIRSALSQIEIARRNIIAPSS